MDNLRFVASKAGYSISADVKFTKVARTKMNGSADSTLARGKAHFEDEIDRRGEKPVSERHMYTYTCVLCETRNSHWYKSVGRYVSASFI